MWGAVQQAFSGALDGINFDGITGAVSTFWGWLTTGWNAVVGVVERLWALFGDDLSQIWDQVVQLFKDAWNVIGPTLKPLWDAIVGFFVMIWPLIKLVAGVLGGAFLFAWKLVTSLLKNVVGPIFGFIVGAIATFIQVLTGVINFITGVFNLDWSKAWEGIGQIFFGLWDGFVNLLSGIGGVLWGIVLGIVEGIVGFFTWLWDVLVGHSIIPDLINGIIDWFQKLPGRVIAFVVTLVTGIVKWFSELPGKILAAIAAFGSMLWTWITQAWQKIKDGAVTKWNDFIAWVQLVPGKVVSGLATLGGLLLGWIKTAWENIKSGATTKFNEFITWVKGIPQTIVDVFKNIGTTLYNAGRNLIQGLIDGAGSLLKSIGSFMADKLPSLLQGPFKKALGIESPSKVFAGFGKYIIRGLTNGLDGGMASVAKRVDELSSTLQGVDISNIGGAITGALNLDAVVAAATPTPTVYGGATANSQTINITGDLSFPNITSGAEAKTFLDNLEALAKG
jgi:phage-related protein